MAVVVAFGEKCAYIDETLNAAQNRHRFVVLTKPNEVNDVAVATISSVKTLPSGKVLPYDQTCKIAIGEHPFITKLSYVAYHLSQIKYLDRLLHRLDKDRAIKIHTNVSDPLFSRIFQGALASKQTPADIKNFLLDMI